LLSQCEVTEHEPCTWRAGECALGGSEVGSSKGGPTDYQLCVDTAVIFSKSLRRKALHGVLSQQQGYTRLLQGMWRKSLFTRSSRCTPQPQRVRPTPHACVSKVADGSRRYKKTCPSRSKERHSCQLVTCTSSRQASSSARASCEPASPAFRNEHHPAHPHRDIDAFAH
jgi:hypothetical protein